MGAVAGFLAALPDGRVIGPFSLALQSPEIGAAFARLQSTEESSTTLSPRIRQIVILTVGSIWKSNYELYAHKTVAQKAEIAQQAIDALANGTDPRSLEEEELLAWQLVRQIAVDHRVSEERQPGYRRPGFSCRLLLHCLLSAEYF